MAGAVSAVRGELSCAAVASAGGGSSNGLVLPVAALGAPAAMTDIPGFEIQHLSLLF
jgi:hypothetical protein